MYLRRLSFRGHVENKYLLLPNYGFPCLHFKIIKIPFTTSRNTINSVKKPFAELSKPSPIAFHFTMKPLIISNTYAVTPSLSIIIKYQQRPVGLCSVNVKFRLISAL